MRIIFYGGRQAGAIGLLTVLSRKNDVVLVIPEDEIVEEVAKSFNLKVYKPEKINSEESEEVFRKGNADLFVSVHGRKIVENNILSLFKFGGINVHPCLYKYKGAKPIERLLEDGETKASVGVHKMTEEVDDGEVITEIFTDVDECKTVVEVYNKLYSFYSIALNEAIDKLSKGSS